MSSPGNFDNACATVDLLELAPDTSQAPPAPSGRPQVELIAASRTSLTSATTGLLQSRLRAVTILLVLIFAVILAWTLAGGAADATGSASIYRNISLVRLAILGAILAVLAARQEQSQHFLRGIEYSLFAALTLLWAYARYQSLLLGLGAGNITELLLEGRTAMIGLFLLQVVHGVFLPHRWTETAKVVLTMALAPALVLVILQARHPLLLQQATELTSWPYVSTNLLIVLVGAILATYTSYVLNNLREEVHEAKQFGQYRLGSKLGSGGMGDVFLAEHVLMKRPCALKLIRADAAADPRALARFEREVRATASLTHPHTIEIYDYGSTSDGTFYYVMEYLPGLSLHDLLAKHGPLPPGRVIYLLRQACSALAEAHAAGLIHRDLKPGNIYVSERGGLCDFVKILDFGLVKLTREPEAANLTAEHVVSGTPLYMPPEQALGDQHVDPRSDLYALGAIGYQMLAGRPPFPGENPVAVMIAHAREAVPRISSHRADVPTDLEEVLLKCLQKSPSDRYHEALTLDKALANCATANDWDARQAALWWHSVCAIS
jgi:tRNA A-37 threonylcarbamoyl transferase component Bud32